MISKQKLTIQDNPNEYIICSRCGYVNYFSHKDKERKELNCFQCKAYLKDEQTTINMVDENAVRI